MAKKQLTLSALKKLDSQLNTTKEIILTNNYTIQLDLHFRQSRIEEVFNKLIEINRLVQNDESLKDFPLEKFAQLLLITNFTSLKNIETKSIAEELEIMNMLIDQGLFKEILDNMEQHCGEQIKLFNEKIFEIMEDRLNNLKQQEEFMKAFNEEIEKQKAEIENKEESLEEEVDEVPKLVDLVKED